MRKTIDNERANNETEESALRIVNTRELKAKLHTIDKMAKEFAILVICKNGCRTKTATYYKPSTDARKHHRRKTPTEAKKEWDSS